MITAFGINPSNIHSIRGINLILVECVFLGLAASWITFRATSGVPRILKSVIGRLLTVLIVGMVVGAAGVFAIAFFPFRYHMGWVILYSSADDKAFIRLFEIFYSIPIILSCAGGIFRLFVRSDDPE